jgi:hypothetical protein
MRMLDPLPLAFFAFLGSTDQYPEQSEVLESNPATPEAAEPSPGPEGLEPKTPPMGDPFRAR